MAKKANPFAKFAAGKRGKEGSPLEERTESRAEAKREGDPKKPGNPFAKKGRGK